MPEGIARQSLFQIETQLAELIEYRDTEDLTPEERAVVDQQIAEYVKREISKVDSVRAYIRHCEITATAAEEEAERIHDYAQTWKRRGERLKDLCKDLMSTLGKKRLEGKTGYLLLKGNGGKQALEIYDVPLIPEEYKIVVMEMNAAEYNRLWDRMVAAGFAPEMKAIEIDKAKLAKALESGHVPGARLKPRGEHVEVK